MRGNRLFRFVDRFLGVPLLLAFRLIGTILPPGILFRRNPDKFLVVKFSALGDTILLLPVLKRLRREYPQARITIIVTSVNRAAVEGCGLLDELIVFDLGMFARPWKLAAFCLGLNRRGFGVALDFDQWLRVSPLLCWLSGAPVRIGFRTPGQSRHWAFTRAVEHAPGRHELDCFFDILRAAGVESGAVGRELFFNISLDAAAEGKKLLESLGVRGDYAVIHPGCGRHGWRRQWPEDRYAAVMRELRKLGCATVVSVGDGEEGVLAELERHAGEPLKAAAGLPLPVLASVIRGARVFISGNTGIMHLAAAVGAPVVALHGPTDEKRWGPVGGKCVVVRADYPCAPCLDLGFEYRCDDRSRGCMEAISVESVVSAVGGILGGKPHA